MWSQARLRDNIPPGARSKFKDNFNMHTIYLFNIKKTVHRGEGAPMWLRTRDGREQPGRDFKFIFLRIEDFRIMPTKLEFAIAFSVTNKRLCVCWSNT